MDKIRRLHPLLKTRGLDTPITVDGGIDPETAPLVDAGATVLVVGSHVYNHMASMARNVARLRAGIP